MDSVSIKHFPQKLSVAKEVQASPTLTHRYQKRLDLVEQTRGRDLPAFLPKSPCGRELLCVTCGVALHLLWPWQVVTGDTTGAAVFLTAPSKLLFPPFPACLFLQQRWCCVMQPAACHFVGNRAVKEHTHCVHLSPPISVV